MKITKRTSKESVKQSFQTFDSLHEARQQGRMRPGKKITMFAISYRDNLHHISITHINPGLVRTTCVSKPYINALTECAVYKGRWYYECTLQGDDVQYTQIGWCQPTFKPTFNMGIGDEPGSYGLDLWRDCVYVEGDRVPVSTHQGRWKIGDVIGCYLDMDECLMWWTKNGETVKDPKNPKEVFMIKDFKKNNLGFCPAAVMHYTLEFNFGGPNSFKFKPERNGHKGFIAPPDWIMGLWVMKQDVMTEILPPEIRSLIVTFLKH